MTKKIVLFASLCLFALSLSAASAEVIPAEYQAKGWEVVIMPQASIAEAIPVPAEFETVDPCPTGCHGGSGK